MRESRHLLSWRNFQHQTRTDVREFNCKSEDSPDESIAVEVTHAALPAPAECAGHCQTEDGEE